MDKRPHSAPQLSERSMPPDFPERIRLNFHRRYYRRKHYHLAICLFMIFLGIWLVSPALLALFDRLALPLDGFSLLDALSSAVLDVVNLSLLVLNGAESVQSVLLGTLSISVLIGMVCMGAGSIWGITFFLPQKSVDQIGDRVG